LQRANESDAAGAGAARESRPTDEPTVLVRKLNSAGVPAYLERVLTHDGEQRFVVVERQPRGAMTSEEASECVRQARVAALLEHPNVVFTRAITVRADNISVTTDYVAGERLSELWSPARGSTATLPLAIALRILIDVATGLGALHKLRSAEGTERVKFVHGEVTDENVLVGLDGVSSVLRASRVRGRNAPTKTGSLAPELLSGSAVDQRADIYSLGALLWRALIGKPFAPEDDVASTLVSAIGTKHAPWALPLADVAARALAAIPDQRFPTASSMVTELRRIAGSKLATEVDVAQFVEAAAGEKIAARLADVQASAVIRKATSIPALPPVPAKTLPPPLPTPPIVERRSSASKFPPLPSSSVKPQPSSDSVDPPMVTAAVGASDPIVRATSVAPTIETPPPQAAPQRPEKPQIPTSHAPAVPIASAQRAHTADTSNRSPLTSPQRVTAPKTMKRNETTATTLAPTTRWVIGTLVALTLLTALLVLLAIQKRQVIVTPAATRPDASTLLEPASSALPEKSANDAKGVGAVSHTGVDSALRTTSSAKERTTRPSVNRDAPAPKTKGK